ncbi:MAG TPA: hypothetical protein PLC81_02850, partial [Bacteroidales bacterium]|nr:hypothetical protein [Bacteroidales bacterium]
MSKKKKKKQEPAFHRFTKKALQQAVFEIFTQHPNQNYNYKQISREFDITDEGGRAMIAGILEELAKEGKLEEVYRGKYRFKVKSATIEGIIEMTSSHNAFVHAEGIAEPVFIARDNLNRALPGDKVK